jgi:endonuclease YncB( thermonuclease family)
MSFRVIRIIDGDTFDVSPDWKWDNQSGNRVRPTGYNAPEQHEPGYETARAKLSSLIFGRDVELRKAYKVDRGRLVCDVYLAGKYLADYFA